MAKKKDEIALMKNELAKLAHVRHLPILTLDQRWHLLFPEEKKTSAIKKMEKRLNDLLKEQGKLIQDAKEMKKLKNSFMAGIVSNMQQSNETKDETARIKKLESSQRYIKEINEKLAVYDNELESIPKEITKVNQQLMIESVRICYGDLYKNKVQIGAMNEWIDKTRTKLKETLVQKQEMEDKNSEIYSYMHDILGPQVIEIFDEDHKEL
ncbi:MAG: hypothetical protein Q4G58_13085 [bacterium]|nr:hypothetical protein [bacterium]